MKHIRPDFSFKAWAPVWIPGVGSKGFFLFSESSHVAYQIYRNEVENTIQPNVLLLFINILPLDGFKKSKQFFS